MKLDPIIGSRQFVDGSTRAIHGHGQRQYVIDDDGDRVYGVFLILDEDEPDLPLIVRSDGAQVEKGKD
jgi:hypothetical protein